MSTEESELIEPASGPKPAAKRKPAEAPGQTDALEALSLTPVQPCASGT